MAVLATAESCQPAVAQFGSLVRMTREDLQFSVNGATCAAWRYWPETLVRPAAMVVMAHGLSGTRRDRLGPFAERFAAAGFGALVFDHRGFGDSEGEPDVFDPAQQLDDWRVAITFARSLSGVDPERIVTFGSSIGGGNALAAAAHDPRIAAAISQVPMLDIPAQAYRMSAAVLGKVLAAAASGSFLPVVGQPSEAALINAPGSEQGWRRVVATGENSRWRDRISTRWLLGPAYQPVRHARDLHCPWLVCVAEADRVAAPDPAIRAAQQAPKGELRTYPGIDHFDIYDGPAHEAVLRDQLDFLRRHVGF